MQLYRFLVAFVIFSSYKSVFMYYYYIYYSIFSFLRFVYKNEFANIRAKFIKFVSYTILYFVFFIKRYHAIFYLNLLNAATRGSIPVGDGVKPSFTSFARDSQSHRCRWELNTTNQPNNQFYNINDDFLIQFGLF